jgi:hypothetical protein
MNILSWWYEVDLRWRMRLNCEREYEAVFVLF